MNYADYASQDTFIGEYMRSMSAQETPYAYDFWCAVWLLGAVMPRHVIVDRPRAPVRLNSYMILVAESGVTRKSTAVRAATALLRDVIATGKLPINVLDSRISTAFLYEQLMQMNLQEKDAHVAISISELAATLGRGAGMHDLPIALTDLYDAPAFVTGGSATKGELSARNVLVSLVGASTPTWLSRAVNPTVIEGGFTSRCLFVVSEHRKKRIAWPTGDTGNSHGWLVQALLSRAEQGRAITRIAATTAAIQHFSKWYESRRLGTDIFRASFDSRADAHILRLAAILSISDRTFELQARHIEQAISIIQLVRNDGAKLFASSPRAVAPPIEQRLFDKLRSMLMQAGRSGMKQSEISVRCSHLRVGGDAINAMLDLMADHDLVQKFVKRHSTTGNVHSTLWRATKLIAGPSARQFITALSGRETVVPPADLSEGVDTSQSGTDDLEC